MDTNEQYFRIKYQFINLSTVLIPKLISNINSYDQSSCITAKRICNAGMKTCDVLNTEQSVSVSLLLNSLWNMFWSAYVAFSATANTATGMSTLAVTSSARTVLDTFTNWDEGLQENPFNDIGVSFYAVLQGVKP